MFSWNEGQHEIKWSFMKDFILTEDLVQKHMDAAHKAKAKPVAVKPPGLQANPNARQHASPHVDKHHQTPSYPGSHAITLAFNKPQSTFHDVCVRIFIVEILETALGTQRL